MWQIVCLEFAWALEREVGDVWMYRILRHAGGCHFTACCLSCVRVRFACCVAEREEVRGWGAFGQNVRCGCFIAQAVDVRRVCVYTVCV